MAPRQQSDLGVRVLLALVVAVACLSVVAASVIFGVDSRTELVVERPEDRSSTTLAGPPSVEGAGPAPTGDPTTDAVLIEIARFVERERGLAFQRAVEVEVLGDEAFQQRLRTSTEKDREQLRTDAQALQALGFVDSVAEVEAGVENLYAAGVLGFYDPDTDELVVRGSDLGPMTRQTIAHELTHALDDQWFDLGRDEYDSNDDEIGFGVSALAEGNARRIDGAYAAELDAEDRRLLREEEERLAREGLPDVPPVLIALISAPYDLGEPLVDSLLDQQDQAGLDDAFRAPPRTSEQVIDPTKYFDGKAAAPVPAPPADAPVLDEGMFGELMVRLVLGQSLGRGRVNRAGTGWGGDRYVVWAQDNGYCIRVDLAGDTPDDVDELAEALGDVAKDRPDARVEPTGSGGVRYTSCN